MLNTYRSSSVQQSTRPKGRRPRRAGPRGKPVRVQFSLGSTNFPVLTPDYSINGVSQGFRFEIPLKKLMPPKDSTDGKIPQDTIKADSRLVALKLILPPIGDAKASGFDILIKGVPNMPDTGTMIGRTNHFLSTTKATYITCRLPLAVTSFYIKEPYFSDITIILQHRVVSSSSKDHLDVIAELRFAEQPIETLVL